MMKLFILLALIAGSNARAGDGTISNADIHDSANIAYSKLVALATNSVVFTDGSGKIVAGQFSGSVINTGSTVHILDGVVTNANLADMAAGTIKCRLTGSGTGVPVDCTVTQTTAILDVFTGDSGAGGVKGLVPAPSAGDTGTGKVLHADGNWSVPKVNVDAPSTYGAVISSTGSVWQASVVAVPACVAISGTDIDWSQGNCFTKTLSANTTLTFSNRVAGQTIIVRTTNPSTYTLTWPNTATQGNSVLWAGSTIPTATINSHKKDIWTVFYDGTDMYGTANQNF